MQSPRIPLQLSVFCLKFIRACSWFGASAALPGSLAAGCPLLCARCAPRIPLPSLGPACLPGNLGLAGRGAPLVVPVCRRTGSPDGKSGFGSRHNQVQKSWDWKAKVLVLFFRIRYTCTPRLTNALAHPILNPLFCCFPGLNTAYHSPYQHPFFQTASRPCTTLDILPRRQSYTAKWYFKKKTGTNNEVPYDI